MSDPLTTDRAAARSAVESIVVGYQSSDVYITVR
jgi:hypothetical protein